MECCAARVAIAPSAQLPAVLTGPPPAGTSVICRDAEVS